MGEAFRLILMRIDFVCRVRGDDLAVDHGGNRIREKRDVGGAGGEPCGGAPGQPCGGY